MGESNKKVLLSPVDLIGCGFFIGFGGALLFGLLAALVAMSLGGPDAKPNAVLHGIAWFLSHPIPYDVFSQKNVGGNSVIGLWAIILNGVIWSVGFFIAFLLMIAKTRSKGSVVSESNG